MANFCQNCGNALTAGAKFCPSCGSPVVEAIPREAPQMQTQPQPQPQPQPVVNATQQFVDRRATAAYQNTAPVKKKKGKGGLFVFLLIVAIAVAAFYGLRDGGWLRGIMNKNRSAQSVQSIIDYAKQLEEAGNTEAASAVYEKVAQGGGAELIKKAHEEISAIKSTDEIKQIEEVFGFWKGGAGK